MFQGENMKNKILVASVLVTFGFSAFAASNVTLYGSIDEGVVVGKAKHS